MHLIDWRPLAASRWLRFTGCKPSARGRAMGVRQWQLSCWRSRMGLLSWWMSRQGMAQSRPEQVQKAKLHHCRLAVAIDGDHKETHHRTPRKNKAKLQSKTQRQRYRNRLAASFPSGTLRHTLCHILEVQGSRNAPTELYHFAISASFWASAPPQSSLKRRWVCDLTLHIYHRHLF